MFEIEKWHPLLIQIAREVVMVAQAQEIKLLPFNGFEPYSFSEGASYEAGVKSLLDLAEHNRPHTKTHSGVWRDLAVHKRKTEVDMIMGSVLPIAKKYGIKIPFFTHIVEIIHNIESGKDIQGDHHLDEMAQILKNKNKS